MTIGYFNGNWIRDIDGFEWNGSVPATRAEWNGVPFWYNATHTVTQGISGALIGFINAFMGSVSPGTYAGANIFGTYWIDDPAPNKDQWVYQVSGDRRGNHFTFMYLEGMNNRLYRANADFPNGAYDSEANVTTWVWSGLERPVEWNGIGDIGIVIAWQY